MDPVFVRIFLLVTLLNGLVAGVKETSDICSAEDEDIFKCADSGCISRDRTCDGKSDCRDGSDESVTLCGCPDGQFACNGSHCIDDIKRCDTVEDCEEGQDEKHCETYTCHSTHIKCGNHMCIPRDLICDYRDDCGDGSDEKHCEYRHCWPSEFRCNNSQCVPLGVLCDNTTDCLDGSDEFDCGRHVLCDNGLYVSASHRCDGWSDCYGFQTDELNCGPCRDDEWQCPNSRCISKANRCDSECDCAGCEDEDNCDEFTCLLAETDRFTCSPRCIHKKYLCDGRNDCRDTTAGSDEDSCPGYTGTELCNRCPDGSCERFDGTEIACPRCRPDQFKCANGKCIAASSKCDGKKDCVDLSDEMACVTHRCPENTRRCKSGQCLPRERWCDYQRDCLDGSDESNCPRRECSKDEFQCSNGQCVSRDFICMHDGKDEYGRPRGCADRSHLWNCAHHQCSEGQFKCRNSYCVPNSAVCNNYIDCIETHMDEKNCPYLCPWKSEECECKNIKMFCQDRNLTTLPNTANQSMSKFYLAGNQLGRTLNASTFKSLQKLTYLDMSNNKINDVGTSYFESLWRLVTLKLGDNNITTLKAGAFSGLVSLRELYLHGNKIRTIHSGAFVGLTSLQILDLSHQRLVDLHVNAFIGLYSLSILNLSNNHLTYIENGVHQGLTTLLILDLRQNRLTGLGNNVFNGLVQLRELHTDEFQFCCVAHPSGKCWPEPDEFSSCEDLMSNIMLRGSIWVLGIIACAGNAVVIIWRIRDKRDSKVHSFLITNLAFGDMLMGVYLMLIASVDQHYRGVYIMYSKYWRESQLCQFAGFLSTFSSELSVFTLTLITADRLICIIFPFRIQRLTIKRARICVATLWLIVILISAVPLINTPYFKNFYGRSGVCLPFHITSDKPNGWEYSVFVFLAMNLLSFVLIFCAYVWMFVVTLRTRAAVRSQQSNNERVIAKKMTFIVMTDFCCWVPIILLGIASLSGAQLPQQVYAWVAVFILPLNSAINPILYTMSTSSFLGTARRRVRKFRTSFIGQLTGETKTSIVDDRASHTHTSTSFRVREKSFDMTEIRYKVVSTHAHDDVRLNGTKGKKSKQRKHFGRRKYNTESAPEVSYVYDSYHNA